MNLENGAFIAKLLLVQAGVPPHGFPEEPGDQYEITSAVITAQETVIVNHSVEYHLKAKLHK